MNMKEFNEQYSIKQTKYEYEVSDIKVQYTPTYMYMYNHTIKGNHDCSLKLFCVQPPKATQHIKHSVINDLYTLTLNLTNTIDPDITMYIQNRKVIYLTVTYTGIDY